MQTKDLRSAVPIVITIVVVALVAACSAEGAAPRGASDANEPSSDGGRTEDASSDASSSSDDEAVEKDAGAPEEEDEGDDPTKDLPTNDGGCLTFTAAQQVCGISSDGAICAHAAFCKATTSKGDCGINCEMQSTVMCLKPADAKCLLDAAAAKSCSDLAKCDWKL